MKYRAIIFDLDGTLAETWSVCFEAFRNTFIKHTGRRFSDAEIEAMYGPDEAGIIMRQMPEDWQSGVETYLKEYEQAHGLCNTPFPGITRALDLLHERGVLIGLVTGKGKGSTDISLVHLKLDHYIDAAEYGHQSGGIKPQAIARLLDKWNIRPDEAAYTGDAASDVEGAHKAGVTALAAAWSIHANYDNLANRSPDHIFQTVDEFIQWIEANTARG